MMDWIDFSRHNPPISAIETVHTVRHTIRLPRVILLTFFDRLPCKELKLTRNNVFERTRTSASIAVRIFPRGTESGPRNTAPLRRSHHVGQHRLLVREVQYAQGKPAAA